MSISRNNYSSREVFIKFFSRSLRYREGRIAAIAGLIGVAFLWYSGVLRTASGAGTAYFVDSAGGSDSNAGTSSSTPWKTLSKVNGQSFQPGDTVNFKRGSVWQGTLTVKSNGTATALVTYRAYSTGAAPQIKNPGVSYGRDITITGQYNVVQDFFLTDAHEAGIALNPGANHNTVQNNEVTASGIGVMASSQYNLLTKNYIHDLKMIVNDTAPSNDYGAVCFWLYAANNEVSYNRGINCIAPSYDFGYDGGFVEVFNGGDNTYIHHNWAQNTEGFFELGGNSSTASAANVKVAYNVINSANGGICLNTGNYAINISNFAFENNTFISTAGHGYRVFQCRSDLSPLRVSNNIFYSNIQIANNGAFVHNNNLYYMANMINGSGIGYSLSSGEKTGNPVFVNLAGADYHLQANSPALDAGLNLGYTADYDGKPVPLGGAPDMGAFEYGASGDSTAPSVPSALSATAMSSSQINLAWAASSDNIGVAGYKVFRAGTQIATVTNGTAFADTGVGGSTTYSYTVSAYDASGNTSAQSAPATATTPAATSSGSNLVRMLQPTTSAGFRSSYPASWATDGIYSTTNYAEVNGAYVQSIRFDLGRICAVNGVKLWHYYGDGRKYHDVIIQFSNDATFSTGVTTVFNNDADNSAGQGAGRDAEYAETSAGKSIGFASVNARYVRLWTNGSTANGGNHYVEVEVYGN